VTSDSTQSAVSATEIGKRAVENNYLFRQEAEEKAVLERKVRLGTATEEEENSLAQINLIDQIRDNEIMAACSQGVSSDSCQSLVQEANYAQYGYEQNLAYNLKFKELYRQDYENVVNILRGKDKDSVDFEKIALSISKSQNISLAEAKSFLSKVMVYKEFAELVGMVRAGTAVKYGVKSDNFATQVPGEMNANSKLPVVGNTEGYNTQSIILNRKEYSASSINAQIALSKKLSALEGAQNSAVKTRILPDGRIRYYEKERLAKTEGPTRGNSFVTEYDPASGRVRQWMESYDHSGKVNRVHPKSVNGQSVNSLHYPPTFKELEEIRND
ncbi:VENN motif pre-toxin domain-containing protein, partial [Bisgaard Taxon 10/6]|uniref:VENN motif pre-toxin domain-containing protein n=1 Tax=Exercitatus varius TaxID=67857 RepID=UPI00294AA8A6